jgi:hypothetical protein
MILTFSRPLARGHWVDVDAFNAGWVLGVGGWPPIEADGPLGWPWANAIENPGVLLLSMRFTDEVSIRLEKHKQLAKSAHLAPRHTNLRKPRRALRSTALSASITYTGGSTSCASSRARVRRWGRFGERCGAYWYCFGLLAPLLAREGDMSSPGSLKGEGERKHEIVAAMPFQEQRTCGETGSLWSTVD